MAEIHHPLDQPAIVGFRDGLTGNRHTLPAIAACIPLRIAYTHTPAMQAGFDSTSLTLLEWGKVLAAGLLAFSVAELQKLVVRCTRLAAYVLDPAASPDQALAWIRGASDEQLLQVARQQLAHDLAAANVPATLRLVRSKDATAVIRETAASTQSGLVVTGVSCNEILERHLLGSTVEKLVRSLSLPLLVVRKRAHGPYRRIVVATDFSEPSRHALLDPLRA